MPDDAPPTATHPGPPPAAAAPDDPTRSGAPDPRAPAADTAPYHTPAPDRTAAAGPPDGYAPPPGVEVPGYTILGPLGAGGMGEVYHARDDRLGRAVAIKRMLGRPDPRAVIRFLAEAQAVAAVRHPNVVQVYDTGDHAGAPYMALEYCPGGTLADRLRGGVRLPPREAADLVRQVADGVAAAHAAGIVHRDLKPGNVLFAPPDGESGGGPDRPKVADFGLAKRAAGADLTLTGVVIGTLDYMSPEQAEGQGKYVGPPADVWALGVVLYECLTGTRPYAADTREAVLARIVRDHPPPPRAAAPGVPRDLDLIVRTCLEKDPAHRYPTAAELAADLGRFLRHEPISVRPLGPVTRLGRWGRRNPALAALTALVVAATAGLIGLLVRQSATERASREEAEKAAVAFDALARQEKDGRLKAERLSAVNDALAKKAEAGQREAEDALAASTEARGLLASMFKSSDPLAFLGADLVGDNYQKLQTRTSAEMLGEMAARALDPATNVRPAARAQLLTTLGVSHRNLGRMARARELLAAAAAVQAGHLPPDHPDAAVTAVELGRLALDYGDPVTAEAHLGRALAAQERAGADEKARSVTRVYLLWAQAWLGRPGTVERARAEIGVRERLFGPDHPETTLVRIGLAALLLDQGRTLEALPLVNAAIGSLRTLPGDQSEQVYGIAVAFQTGVVAMQTADKLDKGPLRSFGLRQSAALLAAARAKAEAVLPADHLYHALIRYQVGFTHELAGDADKAEAEYRAALGQVRRTCGLAHPKAHTLVDHFARLLGQQKRADEGRALYAEAGAANRERFGPDNHWRPMLLLHEARFEAGVGGGARAVAAAREAAAAVRAGKLLPGRDPARAVFEAARAVGDLRAPADARAVARELFEASRGLVEAAYGADSRELVIVLEAYGANLYNGGERARGAAVLEEAEAALARTAPGAVGAADRNLLLYRRGRAEADRGRWAEAERCFAAALALSKTFPDTANELDSRATDATELAAALAAQRRFREAAPLLADAAKWTRERKAPARDRLDADRRVALVTFADGDLADYRRVVEAMAKEFGASTDAAVRARVVWAAGLAPEPAGWDATAAADGLAALLAKAPDAWGYRALAVARLRAGDPGGAEAAVRAGVRHGKATTPADYALYGLVAAARGDGPAAHGYLEFVEARVAAIGPSSARPFAYAGRAWEDRLALGLYLAELRRRVGAPAVAPPPRAAAR